MWAVGLLAYSVGSFGLAVVLGTLIRQRNVVYRRLREVREDVEQDARDYEAA